MINNASNEELLALYDKLNNKFDLLVEIEKDTNCEVKIIKKDVKDIKESITTLVEDFRNFKSETRDVEEKIVLMVSKLDRIDKSVEQEELDPYTDLHIQTFVVQNMKTGMIMMI